MSEPRYWKTEWLDLADRLDRLDDRIGVPDGRVQELLVAYSRVVRGLLIADVNGGLDDEYGDVPVPPDGLWKFPDKS